MRVISPHRSKQRKRFKFRHKPLLVSLFTLAIFISVGFYSFFIKNNSQPDNQIGANEVLAEQHIKKQNTNPTPTDFKNFAGAEFQDLIKAIAYPNTQSFRIQPTITGDELVDKRIRTIAESRGYRVQDVPVAPIEKTKIPGLSGDDLLQPLAFSSWQELKKSAEAEGIPLKLNSGYRSIEMQRQLFMSRLRSIGATNSLIANGDADNQIVSVLSQAAIPGYSRHHTGYTVDFVCANGIQTFETTTCYKWLSNNNYLNAKKHGWIPSYPEGANKQGPEPEPWEYIWVGVQTLLKS